MTRSIMAVLGAILFSASVTGCTGDISEYQQNQISSEYRCTLQPGKKCRP